MLFQIGAWFGVFGGSRPPPLHSVTPTPDNVSFIHKGLSCSTLPQYRHSTKKKKRKKKISKSTVQSHNRVGKAATHRSQLMLLLTSPPLPGRPHHLQESPFWDYNPVLHLPFLHKSHLAVSPGLMARLCPCSPPNKMETWDGGFGEQPSQQSFSTPQTPLLSQTSQGDYKWWLTGVSSETTCTGGWENTHRLCSYSRLKAILYTSKALQKPARKAETPQKHPVV